MSDTRLEACLARLRPHVDADALALTGGVAMTLHVAGSRAWLADVDFVARRMDAVRSSVTRDFLVSHYHVAQPGVKKSIVQLVDPETRLRVDVFPDLANAVARADWCELAAQPWRIVTAADLLAHKLALFARPVDGKHWRDACALAEILSAPLPEPPTLVPDVYAQDLALVCDRCTLSRSADFPLAPKRAIFTLLGHV
ncbi:MAG TPA: hypothetical protein VGL86_21955 [Polyangia bacterium]|jgi:hypothetical protein